MIISLPFRKVTTQENALYSDFRALDFYSHCQQTRLIFQPAKCANTSLCVPIVKQNKPKLDFSVNLWSSCTFSQASLCDWTEATSRTFAANASQWCLWKYLWLLLLGIWCLQERTDIRVARSVAVFRMRSHVFLLYYCPYKYQLMHKRKWFVVSKNPALFVLSIYI